MMLRPTSRAARIAAGATVALASLVGATLLLQPSARAEVAASHVVDRTFLCSTSSATRRIEVEVRSGLRANARSWTFGPTVRIISLFDRYLLGISAATNPSGFSASREHCRPATGRVALSPSGLGGGLASQLPETYDCKTPRRILVRVRSVFRSPTSLRAVTRFGERIYSASGTARTSEVAVRTEAGKPLVYADARDSGKARLFTARSCVRG